MFSTSRALCPRATQAVILEQQQFGRPAVNVRVTLQLSLDSLCQSETGIDVGDDRRGGATDHHGVGKDVLPKRLCARHAAQNPVDGDGVRVTDPVGPSTAQTKRVQKGLY